MLMELVLVLLENVTPAMMTLGWFSNELYKQDYEKMIIGYIESLIDISKEE